MPIVSHLRFTSCPRPDVFLLAITSHYSQSPPGGEPLAAGLCLAYNGNMLVYSQYFSHLFWGFVIREERSKVRADNINSRYWLFSTLKNKL
jgi:hypothetical protein